MIREVFILRLWRESSSRLFLRGQIHHVRTGDTLVFRDWDEMLEYVRRRLEASPSHKREHGLK